MRTQGETPLVLKAGYFSFLLRGRPPARAHAEKPLMTRHEQTYNRVVTLPACFVDRTKLPTVVDPPPPYVAREPPPPLHAHRFITLVWNMGAVLAKPTAPATPAGPATSATVAYLASCRRRTAPPPQMPPE